MTSPEGFPPPAHPTFKPPPREHLRPAAAIATFAERTIGPLYRFATSRLAGDADLTLEIVQTTMTKVLANLAGYRGDGLPDRYARVLEWKYVARLPVAEIATRLGMEAKATESLLGRARQAFRASYQRANAAVEAAAEPGARTERKADHGRA